MPKCTPVPTALLIVLRYARTLLMANTAPTHWRTGGMHLLIITTHSQKRWCLVFPEVLGLRTGNIPSTCNLGCYLTKCHGTLALPISEMPIQSLVCSQAEMLTA